jgi:RND family efflux transporter MFP subunit
MKKTLISVITGLLIGAGTIYSLTSLNIVPKWGDLFSHKGHDHGHDDEKGYDEHDEESNEVELGEAAIRSAGITVQEVKTEKLAEGLDVTAVIQTNQDRLAHVGPRIPGAIVGIKEKAVLGAEVQKDQILATLDGVELGKAKAAYLKQKALLKTAKERVDKETELFILLNRLELGVEAIKYLENKQLLALAKRNYNREQKLFQSKASSERDLLTAQAQYLSAQARFNALGDKLLLLGVSESKLSTLTREKARSLSGAGTTSAREKLESIVAYKTIEAELQAACELLYTLGLNKSDIEALEHDHNQPISSFYLRSPISGRIIEKHATIGEIVKSGRSLFIIADLSTVWILLDIYEGDVDRVTLGQDARIIAPGLKDAVIGKVTYLGDLVDAETRTLKARVEVKNPGLRLKPGMFVQVKLVEQAAEKPVVLLPEGAVQRMGAETVVFIQEKPGHYQKRSVMLGARSGSRVVIAKGLTAGEKVVVTGSFWLKSQLSKSQLGGGHSH